MNQFIKETKNQTKLEKTKKTKNQTKLEKTKKNKKHKIKKDKLAKDDTMVFIPYCDYQINELEEKV